MNVKIYSFLFLLFVFNSKVFSQGDKLVKVTRVVPLYCFAEVLERPSNVNTVIIQGEKTINKRCVDRLRLTFQNSDVQKISNVTFDIVLFEKSSAEKLTLYKGRHSIPISMLPEDVKTFDLTLYNQISPPEGKEHFDDNTSWGWRVEIIKLNFK